MLFLTNPHVLAALLPLGECVTTIPSESVESLTGVFNYPDAIPPGLENPEPASPPAMILGV